MNTVITAVRIVAQIDGNAITPEGVSPFCMCYSGICRAADRGRGVTSGTQDACALAKAGVSAALAECAAALHRDERGTYGDQDKTCRPESWRVLPQSVSVTGAELVTVSASFVTMKCSCAFCQRSGNASLCQCAGILGRDERGTYGDQFCSRHANALG